MSLVPYGFTPDQLAKAAAAQNVNARPAYVEHYRSEAARRYLHYGLGIKEDTTPHLDSNMLRRVSEKNPVLAMVIKTLVNQIAEHFRAPLSEKGLGARVVQRDRKQIMTEAAYREAKQIEEIVFNGGMTTNHPITGEPAVWDGRYEVKADSLNTSVRKMMYDSLVLDRVFIEIEGSAKLGGKARYPIMFWRAGDAGLARQVDTGLYRPTVRHDLDVDTADGPKGKVSYVMLDPMTYQFGVIREYAWDEAAMGFRNPRTEFGAFDYGKSEVEECLDAVLGVLYSMQANKEYFTSNHVPLGILALSGAFTPESLEGLRSHFKQNIGTPGHFYEFPVISAGAQPGNGAQWIPMMDRSRQDLIFKVYMELCVVITAGVFQIQPEEFGFASFGGPTSTLGGADPESTFEQSQHKGLLPKILWLVDFIDKHIVRRLNPEFQFIVQGLEQRYGQEQLLQAQFETTLMEQGYTLNMIRRRNDEAPAYDPVEMDLWREIEKKYHEKWFANDTARTEAIAEEFKKRGGTLGKYFDSPTMNQNAFAQWQLDHGVQTQMQTGDDLRQNANDEIAGSRAEDAADNQGARDQMGQIQGQADERDAEKSALDEEDSRAGNLQIPQAEDARTRLPVGRGGGSSLGKSYASAKRQQRVILVGPRDS